MHGHRTFLLALLCLAVVLGLAGAGGTWWYHTTRPDYRLRQGQEALRHGRPDKADRLAALLEADGYPDHAHLLRGEAFLREQQYEPAAYEFNQIHDQGDLLLEASVIYGLRFLSVKRSFEAERLLRYVVEKQPDHLDAHRGLAVIYFDQGALTLAVQHTKEWARLDPVNGLPYRFMGLIFKDLEQYANARDAYQGALRRNLPAELIDEVKEGLVEVLVAQKDYAKAEAILAAYPPAISGKPKLLACRAECLWALDRAAEAKRLLDRALKEHTQTPELLRLRAKLHLQDNEPRSAALLLEPALKLDRHDYLSRYQLAQAYQIQGRSTEAAEQRRLLQQTQEYLSEMTRLNHEISEKPWDPEPRRRLAAVCEKLGKPDFAAMWRQAATACPPAKE